MIVQYEIDKNTKLTPYQAAQIEFAAKKPYEEDEDNPVLTKEQLKKFKRVNEHRKKA